MDLRYGINPHQPARIIGDPDNAPLHVVSGIPSYINMLDALAAWQLVREAAAATGTVVAASFKHLSPAGAATAGSLDATSTSIWGVDASTSATTSAYIRARDADPKSSFGDMIALSHPIDAELADLLTTVVSDGIIAPGYEPGVAATLAAKKAGAFRVLDAHPDYQAPIWERRDCHGLILEQHRNATPITPDLSHGNNLTADATRDALLGLVTARHTQSNSVVLTKDGKTIGVGAGQQNRVDCVRLAAAKARTWWTRRHPDIRNLTHPTGMRRQEHLNWQIRMAEGDLTATQRHQFTSLFDGVDPDLPTQVRASWLHQLNHLTLVSDGFLPFRDNIDHAAEIGVSHVVEPGGSTRSTEVADACREHNIHLTRTGLRLFNH